MLGTTKTEWRLWMEAISEGHHPEAWRGIMCLLRWMSIREGEGIPPPGGVQNLEDEVNHSKLLRRLLNGQEPYMGAPPESFGDPWYELLDDGAAVDIEVQVVPRYGGQQVLINHGVWTVVERYADDDMEVSYAKRQERYRLQREADEWHLRRVS